MYGLLLSYLFVRGCSEVDYWVCDLGHWWVRAGCTWMLYFVRLFASRVLLLLVSVLRVGMSLVMVDELVGSSRSMLRGVFVRVSIVVLYEMSLARGFVVVFVSSGGW